MAFNINDVASDVLNGRTSGGEAVIAVSRGMGVDIKTATTALMGAIGALRQGQPDDAQPPTPFAPPFEPPTPPLPPVQAFSDAAALERWITAVRQGTAYRTNPDYQKAVEAHYGSIKASFGPSEPPPLPTPPPFSPPASPPPIGKLGEAAMASGAALGLGQTQEGLRHQFEQFLSQEPFGDLNAMFRHVTASREQPLAALFTLIQGLQPGQKSPEEKRNQFLQFLSSQPQQDFFGPVGGQMEGLLQGIKEKLFSGPPATKADANSRNLVDEQSRRAELESDAENIITQYYLEHSNPLVRPFVPDVVRQHIRALQFQNPDVELLRKFIEQEFNI